MTTDPADAYEAHAREFLAVREIAGVGAEVIRAWAGSLSREADVLELGCGGGLPVTRVLVDAGLRVSAIDSSPTMLATFRSRFPEVPVRCERVQESDGFGRLFGAVVAVGLMFLLNEKEQLRLIARAPGMLLPGGRFLFAAPREAGCWKDMTTGVESRSLGRETYEAALEGAGFRVIGCYTDEGNGNYYDSALSAD